MSETFTEIHGKPFVWLDPRGVTHACVGADVHPGVRLIWTGCEQHDVPAGGAHFQRPEDRIDCPKCLSRAPRGAQHGEG